MANFAQRQTIVGLNTTTLFTAPADGTYYIDGSLMLPSLSKGAVGPSAVVTLVKKNGSTQYTGTAGANGFQLNLVLSSGDAITTVLSSSNSADQEVNAVKGVVSCGNAF